MRWVSRHTLPQENNAASERRGGFDTQSAGSRLRGVWRHDTSKILKTLDTMSTPRHRSLLIPADGDCSGGKQPTTPTVHASFSLPLEKPWIPCPSFGASDICKRLRQEVSQACSSSKAISSDIQLAMSGHPREFSRHYITCLRHRMRVDHGLQRASQTLTNNLGIWHRLDLSRVSRTGADSSLRSIAEFTS